MTAIAQCVAFLLIVASILIGGWICFAGGMMIPLKIRVAGMLIGLFGVLCVCGWVFALLAGEELP